MTSMEIKKLEFKKIEVEIRETYIDSDGKTQERTKRILAPTGLCLDSTSNPDELKEESEEKNE